MTPENVTESTAESTNTKAPEVPAPPAPKIVKPVSQEVLILRMERRAARVLMTWTAALGAFLILLGGVIDLYAIHSPSLNGLPPPLEDLGVLLIGMFLGVGVMDRLDRIYAAMGMRKKPVQSNMVA